jgi:hypothetical protein
VETRNRKRKRSVNLQEEKEGKRGEEKNEGKEVERERIYRERVCSM